MLAFNASQFQIPIKPIILLACIAVLLSGCESTRYWWNNNRKVGPNYSTPTAATASSFREQETGKIDGSNVIQPEWWYVFNDPGLNELIETLRNQNLSLKAACYRIKEARHVRDIAAANLLPQSQQATASYAHTQISQQSATAIPGGPLTINDWSVGFNAAWEVDLWGRIRRSISAAESGLEATVHDRNFAIVSLISDAASLYIQIRSFDERIELARENVKIQKDSLKIAQIRFEEGRTSKLDVVQAESNLASTQSLIPQYELVRRQSLNALCVLLGTPPSDVPYLSEMPGRIPEVPPQIIVGIPAELIARRPDIRAAERTMAAQFEQIGISEASLYPTLAFSGTLGWQAARMSDLFETTSFNGTIAPGFSWNILNFGRLKNAVRVEEARYEQIKLDYQNSVLNAQREVEDGIIEFIKRNEQYKYDLEISEANKESVELAITSFKEGKTDFGRVFVVQTNLVLAQDQVVQTRANIALALINTYRALGGGWETDPGCSDCGPVYVASNPAQTGLTAGQSLSSLPYESFDSTLSQPDNNSIISPPAVIQDQADLIEPLSPSPDADSRTLDKLDPSASLKLEPEPINVELLRQN